MDWNAFNPAAALGGGALIGLASIMLFLAIGRIAGISGILGNLIAPPGSETSWRLAFLAGIALGALLMARFLGGFVPQLATGGSALVIAGLLVGYGTRLGAGCTSGHGICGLGRLSPRSLAAVLLFMASAMLTVFVTRHVIGG